MFESTRFCYSTCELNSSGTVSGTTATAAMVAVMAVVISSTKMASSSHLVVERVTSSRQSRYLGGIGLLPLVVNGCALGRRSSEKGGVEGGGRLYFVQVNLWASATRASEY